MRLFKSLAAVALGAVLTASGAFAETPQDTLVIADAIDDIITLDPAEVSEVGGVLISQQIYQPLVTLRPGRPDQDHRRPRRELGGVGRRQDLHLQDEPDRQVRLGQSTSPPMTPSTRCRRVILHQQPHLVHPQPVRHHHRRTSRRRSRRPTTRRWSSKSTRNMRRASCSTCSRSFTGGIVDSEIVKQHEGLTADGSNDYGNAWLKTENSAGSGPFVLGKWDPKVSILLNRNDELLGHRRRASSASSSSTCRKAPPQRLALEKGDIDIANRLAARRYRRHRGQRRHPDPRGHFLDHLLLRPQRPQRSAEQPQGRRGDEVPRRLPGHRRLDRPRHDQGPPDHDPRRVPRRRHQLQPLLARYREGQGAARRVRRRAADHARRPWSGTTRPIPTTPRPCRPPWRRPASTSTCRSSTAASGSTATARTTSTSGSASGARTIPIRTRTPRPSRSTIRGDPDGDQGNLADRFGWNSGELSDMVLAAVQEQDTEKRKAMYDEIQRPHTDTSPFLYMFQDSRKVAMRSNVKGVVLGITFSDDRYGGVTQGISVSTGAGEQSASGSTYPARSRRAATPPQRPLRFFIGIGSWLLTVAITLVGLAALTFFIGRVLPIDPVRRHRRRQGDAARSTTASTSSSASTSRSGVQFCEYITKLLRGDFGISFSTCAPGPHRPPRLLPRHARARHHRAHHRRRARRADGRRRGLLAREVARPPDPRRRPHRLLGADLLARPRRALRLLLHARLGRRPRPGRRLLHRRRRPRHRLDPHRRRHRRASGTSSSTPSAT